jgi:hypothetical protein
MSRPEKGLARAVKPMSLRGRGYGPIKLLLRRRIARKVRTLACPTEEYRRGITRHVDVE